MEKIVTHPLYIRVKKVIESCQSREQFLTTLIYTRLVYDKMKHACTSDNFGDAFSYNNDLQEYLLDIITASKYYKEFIDDL